MSLYSDARTHFQGPPRSVRLHRVCTAGSGAIAKEWDAGIAGVTRLVVGGKECVHCPLLLYFLFLTVGLQPSGYYDQPSRIVSLMENAKRGSEAHIKALPRDMVSSLTRRGICGREVD